MEDLHKLLGAERQPHRLTQALQAYPEGGDTKWAAGYLQLSPSTLNKMRVYGTGPSFYRLGRAIRYRRRELDEWRDRFRASSTTEADASLPRSLTTAEPKRDGR